ncbi:MAG: AMP-binding protein [Syntrophaceae bacterium]|nr:AMP-binding protein [Syntrophaceae bacterium]
MSDGLHLNGIFHDRHSLIKMALARQTDADSASWEKSFWRFISDWFSEATHTTVQTSGSTGAPKILKIKKEYFINSARMTLDHLGIIPGMSALLCLPPEYIAGKMMVVRAAVGELELRVIPPQVDRIMEAGLETDFCAMVPLQVEAILNRLEGSKQLEQIRCLLIGGAPISVALEKRISGLGNRIYATYGMTETVSHIALRRISGPERAPSYRILPGVKVATDENDCLIINAPGLAKGLVRTTDIVRMVGNAEFEILGRRDNIINSGGIKFSPEIIEKKLAPLIADRFIVSSQPDTSLGEKMILIIEASGCDRYNLDVLRQGLQQILHPYECPKGVFFLDAFPSVGNDKISRKKITRRALLSARGEIDSRF